MHIALSAGSAILPALVLLWVFYKRDVNPEPRGMLLKTLLLGMMVIIPVLLVRAIPLALIERDVPNPVLAGLMIAFGCAALPEEFFKYRVLTRYSARHPAFDEPMDGVVCGAAASLGFAALENLMYVTSGGWEVAILRAVTAVPGHACLGAIMGYYVGQARFTPGWPFSPWRGFWVAVLLHGLYDFPIFTLRQAEKNVAARTEGPEVVEATGVTEAEVLVAAGMLVLVDLFALIWTVRIVRRLRRQQLSMATAAGGPTPNQTPQHG